MKPAFVVPDHSLTWFVKRCLPLQKGARDIGTRQKRIQEEWKYLLTLFHFVFIFTRFQNFQ